MNAKLVASTLLLSGCALGVLGCSGGSGGGGAVAAPAATVSPTTSSFDPSTWPRYPAPREVQEGAFASSMACWNCHGSDPTAMRDAAGRDVAPYELHQATLMANAARDPLWRAEISVEIAATPSARQAIETKCLKCHAPMGVEDATANGDLLTLFDLEQTTNRAQLALDGVSCSLCHQIEPTNDVASTFGGAYTVGGQREIYGPHANPDYQPMNLRLGYLPTESAHTTSSQLCASCHTLYTDALRADGTPTGGRLPEQTPFLEWQNSSFNDEVPSPASNAASCQACHTPSTDEDGNPIQTQIARASLNTQVRSTYGRHTFIGGNTLIPEILKARRADLQPLASDAAFDQLIAAVEEQLRQRTATVQLGAVSRAGGDLLVPVTVRNLTGHKFPTGHPVRRAWLRTVVRDAQGQTVFASGAFDGAGRIVNGGAPLPSELAGGGIQPHRPLIDAPDQVQVYQSLMADENGDLTFLLLRGEDYLKDNRLLPDGWDPAHPNAADIAPRGIAGDGDFVGGEDRIVYRVAAPAGAGPYVVEVTLLYQILSARFAAELFTYSTPEVDAFRSYYEAADRRPDVVDRAVVQAN